MRVAVEEEMPKFALELLDEKADCRMGKVESSGRSPALDGRDNQAVDQIVAADRVVINKIDLVGEAEVQRLEGDVRRLNQTAEILRSTYAKIDLERILNVGGFAPSYVRERAELLDLDGGHGQHDEHAHGPLLSSESFVFERHFERERIAAFFKNFHARHARDVFRSEGILAVAGDSRFHVLQAVHALVDFRPDHPWAKEKPFSKLVFIGRNLDRGEIERGLAACLVSA